MSKSQDLGQTGEDLAADHLRQKGCTIIFRNWMYGKNEIDIIAENRDFIIFVEVKTRSEDFLDHPVNAITREKQRSMIFAADGFMKRTPGRKEARFDVIYIIRRGENFDIEHIEAAFYPTLR